MRILLVVAHPLQGSFAAAVAATAQQALEAKGHSVDLLDPCREDFDQRLSPAERDGYFDVPYDASGVSGTVERLQAADGLILVFPQWWFNFPAILKGFFDRVFVPGVAFAHDADGGRIAPQLTNIKLLWALTTTGSKWWLVHLYMGNPVRRLLKRGIANVCSKGVNFRMLSLHDMDRATEAKRSAHLARVRKALGVLRLFEGGQKLAQQRVKFGLVLVREALRQVLLIGDMGANGLLDDGQPRVGEGDQHASPVFQIDDPLDETRPFQLIDSIRHGAGGHHRHRQQLAGRKAIRHPGTPERCKHIE
jgi:putative NADPH-quinone reductase